MFEHDLEEYFVATPRAVDFGFIFDLSPEVSQFDWYR